MEQENNHEKRRGGKNRNWVEDNVHGSYNPSNKARRNKWH